MVLGTLVVGPDEALAAFVAGGAALVARDAHARSDARVWQVAVTWLGLGLAFRVRILLPAREPSVPQVALNRSKCNGNREFSVSAMPERRDPARRTGRPCPSYNSLDAPARFRQIAS